MLAKLFANHIARDFLWSVIILISLYALTHNPFVRPMPEPKLGNWSIEFKQHPLLFGFAGHNYLALRDDSGMIVSELHGLATDKMSGTWKYIGSRPSDILQVWEFEKGKYLSGTSFPGIILKEGTGEDVRMLWNSAETCMEEINRKRIPYPPYGFSLRNETLNSNSVAYTLSRCMGLDTVHIGLFTPGSAVDLLGR